MLTASICFAFYLTFTSGKLACIWNGQPSEDSQDMWKERKYLPLI